MSLGRPGKHGILVVFSGPSGAGKDTVLKRYFADRPPATLSVSATTRAPRPGETDGVHYHFVTRERFERMIRENAVLEYNVYNGHYYGSPREPIERELARGRDVILEIETNGAEQIRRMYPSVLSVFVMPPSFKALGERLAGRGTESPEDIEKRLLRGREEMARAREYDYIVVNDRVDEAAGRLAEIIRSAHWSRKYNQQYIEEVLNNA